MQNAAPPATFLYVGHLAPNRVSEGVRIYQWDADAASLTRVGSTNEGVQNPTFVKADPAQRLLLAADCPVDWDRGHGAVSTFAIDQKSGLLSPIDRHSSAGIMPVHLSVASTGGFVAVANYGPLSHDVPGRTVTTLGLTPDGHLSEVGGAIQHEGSSVDPERQTASRPHAIQLDRANRFALVADLGTDQVVTYPVDPHHGLLGPEASSVIECRPGSGPRFLDFHPNGRVVYLDTEMSNSIVVFAYDESSGELTPLQTISTMPAGVESDGAASDIHVHPSGKIVFAANRRHQSIAVFTVDLETGQLTLAGHAATGRFPRSFAVDPAGVSLLVGNEASGTITAFRIHPDTGGLDDLGSVAELPGPGSLEFVSVGGRAA